jgi:hypothetical protein
MAATAITLSEIRKLIDRVVEEMEITLLDATRKTAFDVLEKLIDKTPRDTGRAVASWRVSVGPEPDLSNNAPDEAVTNPVNAGSETDTSDGVDVDFAVDMASINETLNSMHVPDLIWITNSLPYIIPLEQGHSDQAPAGFLQLTAEEIKRDLVSLLED